MAPRSHGTAAVIGASGFLGRALTRRLECAGTHVVRVTRQEPALSPGGHLRPDLASARTLYWAASRINPLIASQRPDLVAADLADFTRFLDAVHAENPAARVVVLSSGGTVYGVAHTPPHDETTTPRPANEYGRAKLAIEDRLHRHDLASSVVRISNAYGPGQQAAPGQGVIGHWLRSVRAGLPVTVFGDLDTVRDYVYVDDVVDALALLHDVPSLPATLNVGTGAPTTLAQVVEAINDVVGPRRLQVVLAPRRPFDIPASWLDVGLAASTLGWTAQVPLGEGVQAMWRWLSTTD